MHVVLNPCFIYWNHIKLFDIVFSRLQPVSRNKFIVYETCIMELFKQCPVCSRTCRITKTRSGTYLAIRQLCCCGHTRSWQSQPLMKSTPAGNLELSAAVYLSGAYYKLVKRVCFSLFFIHLIFFGYLYIKITGYRILGTSHMLPSNICKDLNLIL